MQGLDICRIATILCLYCFIYYFCFIDSSGETAKHLKELITGIVIYLVTIFLKYLF
jgi:hypothetical protein